MLGFTLVALVQAALILGFGLVVLDLYNAGSVPLLFGIEVLLALAAVNLGIFLSTFARNEFQAVQFIPLVIITPLTVVLAAQGLATQALGARQNETEIRRLFDLARRIPCYGLRYSDPVAAARELETLR